MIKIIVDSNNINISGHANYSNGEDIVCASVSSIMYTTVNAILKFDQEAIEFLDNKKEVNIKKIKDNKTTNILIDNMISLLLELESLYPKNIKIKMEE